MAVRMARFAFRRRAEDRGDVVLPLDVRLAREIKIAPIRLRFAGERSLQVVVRFGARVPSSCISSKWTLHQRPSPAREARIERCFDG
jgi:hypothetical protein